MKVRYGEIRESCKCICRDMMVVVIPQTEHTVLEVKVLQSIGFLGGSMVETKIKVPDDSYGSSD